MIDNNFELGTELDTEILIADLPFVLLNERIMSQIDNPLLTNENYIMTIMDKCELLKKENSENLEYIRIIDEESSVFFRTVIDKINNKYNLGLDLSYFDSFDAIRDLGEVLYNYFILGYFENISSFVLNYIKTNKELFYREFGQRTKKDVSTLAMKKRIKDKQKLAIYANISSIVIFTLNSDITNEEFISFSRDEEDYESEYLLNLINMNVLVGDFVRTYVDSCIHDKYHSILDTVITDVKDKLSAEYGMVKN